MFFNNAYYCSTMKLQEIGLHCTGTPYTSSDFSLWSTNNWQASKQLASYCNAFLCLLKCLVIKFISKILSSYLVAILNVTYTPFYYLKIQCMYCFKEIKMKACWTLLFLVLVGATYARVLSQDEEDNSEYYIGNSYLSRKVWLLVIMIKNYCNAKSSSRIIL